MWTLKYDMKYVKMYGDKIVKNANVLHANNSITNLQKKECMCGQA